MPTRATDVLPRGARTVLGHLRATAQPLSAAEVAGILELHVTTARFHLDRLERAGLVARVSVRSGTRGRPTVRYRPVGADLDAVRDQMIDVLAQVAAAGAGPVTDAAEAAGRDWAGVLPLPAGPAAVRLAALAEGLGFDPEPCDVGLRLRGCPFRSAARRSPQVVCTVHRGLIQSAVAGATDAGTVRAGLIPFATPDTCHLTISTTSPKEPS